MPVETVYKRAIKELLKELIQYNCILDRMVYTGIIIFLFTHQFAFSQKGEFYIPVEKSEVLIDNIDGNVRYKAVNLSKPVNFFGKNVTKIWVRYFFRNSACSPILVSLILGEIFKRFFVDLCGFMHKGKSLQFVICTSTCKLDP